MVNAGSWFALHSLIKNIPTQQCPNVPDDKNKEQLSHDDATYAS